jgi:hypothetical protein
MHGLDGLPGLKTGGFEIELDRRRIERNALDAVLVVEIEEMRSLRRLPPAPNGTMGPQEVPRPGGLATMA